MAYNLERCFHRAMMKHFPGEDGDTDDEFWIREDGKREKRSRRTIRSSVWTRSKDSDGPGKRQQHLQNGGKLPPHRAKHRVPSSSSSSLSSSVDDPSSSSMPPTGEVASPNGRGFLQSHHYGGMPSHISHPGQMVNSSLVVKRGWGDIFWQKSQPNPNSINKAFELLFLCFTLLYVVNIFVSFPHSPLVEFTSHLKKSICWKKRPRLDLVIFSSSTILM